jgi:hypothetical protein
MIEIQCDSRAVWMERKHQQICLCYYEFTTVYQPSCLRWKKVAAKLLMLRWFKYNETAELFEMRESGS